MRKYLVAVQLIQEQAHTEESLEALRQGHAAGGYKILATLDLTEELIPIPGEPFVGMEVYPEDAGNYVYIPQRLVDRFGDDLAFELFTGLDRREMYSCYLGSVYDPEGNELEEQ